VFEKIEQEIQGALAFMGMPDAALKIQNNKIDELTPDGIDQVKFLFSANRGLEPKELSKVASGGERSRLMLAVKSLISQKNLLPTIIFDEIDNGISGDIAGRVGDVMQKTAQNMQVIAITHLPQIAGKGNHHFTVFKEYDGKITRSRMKELKGESRVDELAKMLSGTGYSDAARTTAQELLKN
jgi:DNA repair protein RecN (Recombination protein N)